MARWGCSKESDVLLISSLKIAHLLTEAQRGLAILRVRQHNASERGCRQTFRPQARERWLPRDGYRPGGAEFAIKLQRIVEHLDIEGFRFARKLDVSWYSP